MNGVLSLSTYPVVKPRHGGQLRIRAFGECFARLGVPFDTACVYESPAYGGPTVGFNDLPLIDDNQLWPDTPFIGDLRSGVFAAESPAAYAHFVEVVKRTQPRVIQLDHPFMWPLVAKLREKGKLKGVKLWYASHNFEGPLKEAVLRKAGVTGGRAAAINAQIQLLENDIVEVADAVIAVSENDAAEYRAMRADVPVIVVPNGVARPPSDIDLDRECARMFEGRPLIFFVGSAYPPNIEGYLRLVVGSGLYFTPPRKHFAICGGCSEGIFKDNRYGRRLLAHSERVHFFPDVDDADLWCLKAAAHVMLLPIEFGGGSNLKTAEALASGKWVVATSTALRGFEQFAQAPGVLVADTPEAFRAAIVDAIGRPPLQLTAAERKAREAVHWDRGFEDSGFEAMVQNAFRSERARAVG